MNEREEENGPHSVKSKSENQPYRMRLPGFIFDEEIGLGDAVKRVTYAFGIRPSNGCGCEHRAEVLNRWVVFSPWHSR